MTMARSRGAIVGPLLMLLGAWGALVPFFGHSFGYGYTPSNTWSWTAARGWMEVAPGAGAFLGGVIITGSAHRAAVTFGTWLAVLSGAWFVLGTVFSPWWNAGFLGTPVGSDTHVVLERLGMFSGLGVVIVAIAAMAFGRFTIVGIRDAEASRRRLDAYQKIEESPPVSADPEQFADRPTSDAR
jgi:hypothetical protein